MRRHGWYLAMGVGILAGLLVLLATLQVRWLDQVAQTITAQKRAALFRRGTALVTGLDRELSRVFHWFELDRGPNRAMEGEPPDAALVAERLRSWRQTGRHTPLIKEIWFLVEGGRPASFRFEPDTGIWQPAPWPEPERPRGLGPGGRLFGLLGRPMPGGDPLLGVPADGPGRPPELPGPPGAAPGPPPGPPTPSALVVRLDGAYLQSTLLPALAAATLVESAGEAEPVWARLEDATGRGWFVWPAGASGGRGGEHEPLLVSGLRPDLTGPGLLAGMSPPPRRTPAGARGGPGRGAPPFGLRIEGGRPPGPRGLRFGGGLGPAVRRVSAWQLSLGYLAGPVDDLVTGLRRRNVALGLSILALLGGAIAALTLAVRRAQALAERQRQFMASVSHELRTPLAVIGSAAENLRDGTVDDGPRVREYGEMIHAESKRLHALVDDVLRLAAGRGLKDDLTLRPLDVRQVVDAAIEAFLPELRSRGGRVERSAPDEPTRVAADPQALRQAVENVVGNAVKYGGEAPAIAVRITRVSVEGRAEVQIAVEDRGLGIAADELGQIFEPFFRGREAMNRQIRGTGLGLVLVSRVMKAHGGAVTVESTPGRATRFVLHLPALAGDEAPEPAA